MDNTPKPAYVEIEAVSEEVIAVKPDVERNYYPAFPWFSGDDGEKEEEKEC